MPRPTWLLALLLVPHAQAAVPLEIAGFAADLPGSSADDVVFVRNRSDSTVALEGYSLSDGEGVVGFPPGAQIGAHGRISVAGRAGAYQETTGDLPDFALEGLDARHTMRVLDRGFALALSGDEVRLVHGGVVLDRVVYGDASTEGDGWLGAAVNVSGRSHLRWFPRLDLQDDDDRSDWQGLGRRILGADEYGAVPGNATQVHGFTAPESSRAFVARAIASAQTHLRINVYQWRDLGLVDVLRAWRADHPHARLDVLLAPNPVGESRDELSDRAHVIQAIRSLDGEVHFASRERYPYNHAKYIVADERWILVQSENLVPSGIPLDASEGNRGYGVLVHDPSLGRKLAAVFDEDFRIEPHGATQASLEPPPYPAPLRVRGAARAGDHAVSAGPAQAWLIIAPQAADPAVDPILQRIRDATSRIRVAQLSLPPTWLDAEKRVVESPYLRALLDAAGRGVHVQVLLDGNFIEDDAADPADNQDTLRDLQARAAGAPIEARLMRSRVLHAKTMLVDDEWSLVGSMNWNANSILHNREVSILVRDPALAAFHARTFDQDWSDAGPPSSFVPGLDAMDGLFVLCVLLLLFRHSKRSYHGPP